MILFTHGKKKFGVKKENLLLSQWLITFSPIWLATIYLKTDHFIPQRRKKRLETIEENKRREIEGESGEGEKVIWCEEIGKYEGVFIGENGSVGYKNHKCGKKKTCKWCKKRVD